MNNKVDQLVLVHLFGMVVGNQEGDIISLHFLNNRALAKCSVFFCLGFFNSKLTSTGFLRKITKLSALIIKKRENLWHRIRSRSSACLILMLTRTELTEGSIRTFSFSLRLITRGFINSSLDFLHVMCMVRRICVLYSMRSFAYPDSISGVLCLSATWEEKFSKHKAAVKVERTAVRYGRSVLDYIKSR